MAAAAWMLKWRANIFFLFSSLALAGVWLNTTPSQQREWAALFLTCSTSNKEIWLVHSRWDGQKDRPTTCQVLFDMKWMCKIIQPICSIWFHLCRGKKKRAEQQRPSVCLQRFIAQLKASRQDSRVWEWCVSNRQCAVISSVAFNMQHA